MGLGEKITPWHQTKESRERVNILNVRKKLNEHTGMGGYCWFSLRTGEGGYWYTHEPMACQPGGADIVALAVPHSRITLDDAEKMWYDATEGEDDE